MSFLGLLTWLCASFFRGREFAGSFCYRSSISLGGMLLVHTKCVVKRVKKEARACVYEVVLTMMLLICEEWIGRILNLTVCFVTLGWIIHM